MLYFYVSALTERFFYPAIFEVEDLKLIISKFRLVGSSRKASKLLCLALKNLKRREIFVLNRMLNKFRFRSGTIEMYKMK